MRERTVRGTLDDDFRLFRSRYVIDCPECIESEQSRDENRDERDKVEDGGRQIENQDDVDRDHRQIALRIHCVWYIRAYRTHARIHCGSVTSREECHTRACSKFFLEFLGWRH